MAQKEKIVTAIKGALTTFEGFGEYIVTSEEFSNSAVDVNAISDLDNEVKLFYDNYPPNYYNLTQYFVFPYDIAGLNRILILLARKNFTAFPNHSRFYDRREYYYFLADSTLKMTDVLVSLPEEMSQYGNKQLKGAPDVKVDSFKQEKEQPGDKEAFGFMINHFLEKEPVIIKLQESKAKQINLRVLGLINRLPTCYQKYLGLGANISGDSPLIRKYIHIHTTLDDNGGDLEQMRMDHQLDSASFANHLFQGNLNYNDTELKVLGQTITKNSLSELIGYHLLHFEIDQALSDDAHKPSETIYQSSRRYIETFLKATYNNNAYLMDRVFRCYQAWQKHDLLPEKLLLDFWKKILFSGIDQEKLHKNNPTLKESLAQFTELSYRKGKWFKDIGQEYQFLKDIKSVTDSRISLLEEIRIKYVQFSTQLNPAELEQIMEFVKAYDQKTHANLSSEILKKFNLKTATPASDPLEILKLNIKELDQPTIETLMMQIGLGQLTDYVRTKSGMGLLQYSKIRQVIEQMIKSAKPATITDWINIFKTQGFKLNFDLSRYVIEQSNGINSGKDILLFKSVSELLMKSTSLILAAEVKSFLNGILHKPGCQQIDFYLNSFLVCGIFNCKIEINERSLAPGDTLNYLKLFQDNERFLANPNAIESIKNNFKEHLSKTTNGAEFILNLQANYKDLLRINLAFFNELLQRSLENTTPAQIQKIMLVALEIIGANNENLFLKRSMVLYDYILNYKFYPDKEFKKSLKNIKKQFESRGMSTNDDVILLIDHVLALQTDEAKNGNSSAIFKQILKPVTRPFYFFILMLIIIGFTILGGVYALWQNGQKMETIHLKSDTIRMLNESVYSLKSEINRLEEHNRQVQDSANFGGSTIFQNPQSLKLSPTPNKELNGRDLNAYKKLKNYTLSGIVEMIFKNNPNDVRSHYKNQKKQYMDELLRRNPASFDSEHHYVVDSLQHIPAYKN